MMKINRREIGSEFWEIPLTDTEHNLFPQNTCWFLSGRSALECILADIRKKHTVRSVAMPAWCCDSMVKPFVDAGLQVRFYPVYPENHRLVQDISVAADCDILFQIDYFGYARNQFSEPFSGLRIRDLTHNVFVDTGSSADYAFGSLRKWAGFYTGGFGWPVDVPCLPKNTEYIDLRKQAMEAKKRYIKGISETKEHLAVFGQAEELLDHCLPAQAAERDIQAAKFLDVELIKKKRRANAARLLEAFSDIAVFGTLQEQDCPLFVPILVPEKQRDALRRHLIEQEIYCPIHWPLTGYQAPDERSSVLYRQSLSLVCDQRYGQSDMDRLIDAINNFWKG